jgi:hypothetical protein
MRKINLLWLIGIFMLIPVSFTSCSGEDDKEEESGSTSKLVGTWETVSISYQYKENGEITDEGVSNDYFCMVFNKDGIYETADSKNEEVDEWGTWSYNNGEIMIDTKFGSSYSYIVKTLTKSKLVLEYFKEYTEDGIFYEKYELAELRKISD